MKYELGDYVEISHRWKNEKLPAIPDDPEDFGAFAKEQTGDEYEPMVQITKLKRIPARERGFICGVRYGIKKDFFIEADEESNGGYGPEVVRQTDANYIDVYLVATQLGAIRRVSKEDINLIADNSKFKGKRI